MCAAWLPRGASVISYCPVAVPVAPSAVAPCERLPLRIKSLSYSHSCSDCFPTALGAAQPPRSRAALGRFVPTSARPPRGVAVPSLVEWRPQSPSPPVSLGRAVPSTKLGQRLAPPSVSAAARGGGPQLGRTATSPAAAGRAGACLFLSALGFTCSAPPASSGAFESSIVDASDLDFSTLGVPLDTGIDTEVHVSPAMTLSPPRTPTSSLVRLCSDGPDDDYWDTLDQLDSLCRVLVGAPQPTPCVASGFRDLAGSCVVNASPPSPLPIIAAWEKEPQVQARSRERRAKVSFLEGAAESDGDSVSTQDQDPAGSALSSSGCSSPAEETKEALPTQEQMVEADLEGLASIPPAPTRSHQRQRAAAPPEPPAAVDADTVSEDAEVQPVKKFQHRRERTFASWAPQKVAEALAAEVAADSLDS